jgi:uncharacterized membrane protein YhaH (DUF805 family)
MDLKKEFQTYYVSALKRYADFKGRTSRKAYWMFVLFNVLISWAVIALDNIIGTEEVGRLTFFGIYNGMFNNFYGLIMLIPSLAIAVRRLHDVGKEGKFFFWIFLPVVGWIMLLLELIKVGDAGQNQFGPVPKDGEDWQPSGHPYAPNQGSEAGSSTFADATVDRQKSEETKSFDISEIRKEAEKAVAFKKQTEKKDKPKVKVEKIDRTVKWGRDRGAKDFRSPTDKKRKI